MKRLLYLLPILLLCACHDPNAKDIDETEIPGTHASPAAAVATIVAATDDDKDLQASYKQLQGTWQSEEDRKYLLVFKDRKTYDLYEGHKDSTAREFRLSHTSCNQGTNSDSIKKYEGEYPLFLIKKFGHRDMCYEVQTLTNDQLTLMYLDHGNILSFKKIK